MMTAGTDFRVKEAHLRTLRTQHELLKRVWEPLIYSKTEIEPDSTITLLDIYWTWQHPLHNCVYHHALSWISRLEAAITQNSLSIFALAARHANENDEHFKYLGKGA